MNNTWSHMKTHISCTYVQQQRGVLFISWWNMQIYMWGEGKIREKGFFSCCVFIVMVYVVVGLLFRKFVFKV